jgi:hypothetical protein
MAVRDAENSWLWSGGSRGRVVAVGRLQWISGYHYLYLLTLGRLGYSRIQVCKRKATVSAKKLLFFCERIFARILGPRHMLLFASII